MADNLAFPVSTDAAGTGNGALVYDIPTTSTATTFDGLEINISGTLHVVYQEVYDGAGGQHLIFKGSAGGLKGTDTLGRSYVGSSVGTPSFQLTPGATIDNIPFRSTFIGQGGAPDVIASGIIHSTTTPDGTLTADFYNFKYVER